MRGFSLLPAIVPSCLALISACSVTHLAPVPGDAAPGAPDARGVDGDPISDAWLPPDGARADAFVPVDAAPLGGCFDGEVEVWSSARGASERAHARVLGAVAYEHGWIVAVSDLSGADQLIFTDREGVVRSVSDIELYGETTQAFVEGDALYLFHGYWLERYDIDRDGITRGYSSVLVGGSTARAEGILAVEPLSPSSEGFRALSLHYDTSAGAYLLRISDLLIDAREPSGVTQVSSTVDPERDLPGLLAAPEARIFLDGDHLRVFARAGAWRVLDVQLGLGSIGADPVIGVRFWSDAPWPMGPELVLGATSDREFVLTARMDPITSAYFGHVEPLPGTGTLPEPRGDGIPLGYGSVATSMLDEGTRIVVATHEELSVLGRDDGARMGDATPLGAAPNVPLVLAREGEHVAVAFIFGDGAERRVGLRCATLPGATR